jgi:hypothetical protein
VKGKSPQGPRAIVQIEQYFLYSATQLMSCSSPTAAASRLTSSLLPRQPRRKPTAETCVNTTAKLRPQASVLALRAAGANQLLRPASTTPLSYGRRHRSWHAHFKHAATPQPRRKPSVDTCVNTTAKLRPQASVLALQAAGANQPLRPASTTPRSQGVRHAHGGGFAGSEV